MAQENSSRSDDTYGEDSCDNGGNVSGGDRPEWLQFYIAIYAPYEGYFYHWAFCVYDVLAAGWHVYEAVRYQKDGPFHTTHRRVNPTNSAHCLRPLNYLGRVSNARRGVVFSLLESVGSPARDCQEYVYGIADRLAGMSLLRQDRLTAARAYLAPYFGRQRVSFEDQQQAEQPREGPLSEEYIDEEEEDDEWLGPDQV